MNDDESLMNNIWMHVDEIDYSFHFDLSFKAFSKYENTWFCLLYNI
jgi:hypothetical protein